jgi:hypothetical protein
VRSLSGIAEDFASGGRQANLQVFFDTLLSSVFGTRRPLPFRFLVFRMPILWDVKSIGSRLRGLVSFLGSLLVSWSSHKQSSVAQSTTKAEYVAAASCCSQLLWITYTLSDW